ncbi:37127_t:CDS:2, partial [Racocetra persica]
NSSNLSAIITSNFATPVTNINNSATPVINASNFTTSFINTSNPITHTTFNNPATNIITTSSNLAIYIAFNSSNSAKINFQEILAELITPNNENEMSIDSSSEEE